MIKHLINVVESNLREKIAREIEETYQFEGSLGLTKDKINVITKTTAAAIARGLK